MNKQELIKHLAAHADVSNKQAESVLNALTTTILDTVRAGNELAITDRLPPKPSPQAARPRGRLREMVFPGDNDAAFQPPALDPLDPCGQA